MNTRRKFLQMASLFTGAGILAKSAHAIDSNLSRIESNILGKSLRKLRIAHSAKMPAVSGPSDKLFVHPAIGQDPVTDQDMVTRIYQNGLVKTGVIYCTQPAVQHGSPASSYIIDLCAKAAALKKEQQCQAVLVYMHITMPDAKTIVQKDLWVAQMHSVDVLFTQEDKKKNFARICQDRDRNELILAPLHNKKDQFGGIDFLFDVGLNKSQVSIT